MTNQTQGHTPGKWTAKPATLNIKDPMFYKADVICGGIRIAQVAGVGEGAANNNALLIAACPTMYDFIKAEAKQGNKKAIDLLGSINC